MKVTKVEKYLAKDNSPRWRVSLENDDKPLIMGWEPPFKEGDDISQDRLKLTTKGDRSYYVWQKEARPKKSEDTPERSRSMCLSYAKDLAVAGKVEVVEILTMAGKFYDWVKQ